MTLLKNKGDVNATLSWNTWNFVIEPGETKDIPPVVAAAFLKRYPTLEEIVMLKEEPVVEPKKGKEEEPISTPANTFGIQDELDSDPAPDEAVKKFVKRGRPKKEVE